MKHMITITKVVKCMSITHFNTNIELILTKLERFKPSCPVF